MLPNVANPNPTPRTERHDAGADELLEKRRLALVALGDEGEARRVQGQAVRALVERFDIEPFPDFSAK